MESIQGFSGVLIAVGHFIESFLREMNLMGIGLYSILIGPIQ